MVPAVVGQNVNSGCEQAQADHDGGENAASDAEPTKPSPARRRGYQPETSDWGGCGRHALYMVLRNTVPFGRASDRSATGSRRTRCANIRSSWTTKRRRATAAE